MNKVLFFSFVFCINVFYLFLSNSKWPTKTIAETLEHFCLYILICFWNLRKSFLLYHWHDEVSGNQKLAWPRMLSKYFFLICVSCLCPCILFPGWTSPGTGNPVWFSSPALSTTVEHVLQRSGVGRLNADPF